MDAFAHPNTANFRLCLLRIFGGSIILHFDVAGEMDAKKGRNP
jgi:hypothetical protein